MAATSDTLTAAWLAEHVMGWHLVEHVRDPHEGDVILRHWVDDSGEHQAPEIGWDPLARDADAMRMLDAISAQLHSRYLLWSIDKTLDGVTCEIANEQPTDPALWYRGKAQTRCKAICRAAEAYVMKQL